ncbi:MAG: GNAT family N-acetyltransferase [Bacteroidota bacterium]
MELFQYDLSAHTGAQPNDAGLFGYKYLDHYWTEEGRDPYLCFLGEEILGFVLVNEVLEANPRKTGKQLAEFFILRKFQRKGWGRQLAETTFSLYPGYWEVSYLASNLPAKSFWTKIISEISRGNYQEVSIHDDWYRTVLCFNFSIG